MAVTTGILAVAGGALAVEAFAADVADGEVGVDFFSAAGLGLARPELASKSWSMEAEVAGGFGGSVFSGFGDLETFGGAAVFAVVAVTLVDGFSGVATFALAFTGTGSGFGGGVFFASGDWFFVEG